MTEDAASADLCSKQPYSVTTYITAHPLTPRRCSPITLERGYGLLGRRSFAVLLMLFLAIGTVVATPLVVNRLRSDPVCVAFAVQIRNSVQLATEVGITGFRKLIDSSLRQVATPWDFRQHLRLPVLR